MSPLRWNFVVSFFCCLAGLLVPGAAFALAPATSQTGLTVSSGGSAASAVDAGSVVTLTATVQSGGAPVSPGQVKFCEASAKYCEDSHLLATAQLTSAGTAAFSFRPGIGSHSYKAVFVGTDAIAGSTSASSASL